jgi:hypothetical protein
MRTRSDMMRPRFLRPVIAAVAVVGLLASARTANAQAFTPGNLVIYRVGDGVAGLSNTGAAIFLDEYTTTGTLVQSIALPSSGANAIIASGTATSEGFLTRSPNGQFLTVTGYNRPVGGTGSVVSTLSTNVPRSVAVIGAGGTIVGRADLTDWSSGNNPRSAVTTNRTDIWVAGAAGGVRYTTAGSSTSTQLSTTVTNVRNVNIFDGQLYVSTGSGSAVRVGTVGTGTPTTAGQTITNLPGFPTDGSPYAYQLLDLDGSVAGPDTLYVASDDAGAVTKYSLVSGNWVSNGTVGVAGDAYRGLTARVSGGVVELYATRKGGNGAAGGGELVLLSDPSGYNGAFTATPTLLATALTNTAFRGVEFVPVPEPTTVLAVAAGGLGLVRLARRRRAQVVKSVATA